MRKREDWIRNEAPGRVVRGVLIAHRRRERERNSRDCRVFPKNRELIGWIDGMRLVQADSVTVEPEAKGVGE